jgi:TPR repeat protein
MAHQVFISFSSKDVEVATKIRHGLETRHVTCWMSTRDVPVGADFQEAIIAALEAAQMMVLVFSTNANNSNEMKKELVLAGQYELPVLPVRIENVLPSGAFRFQLTTRQYLDLFEDWDANMAKLALQINQFVDNHRDKPAATPEPMPSEEASWNAVKDSKDPDALNGYLAQFPQSGNAEHARQRLAMLEQERKKPPDKELSRPPRPWWRKAGPGVAGVLVVLWLIGINAEKEPDTDSSSKEATVQSSGATQDASAIPALSWSGFEYRLITPEQAQAGAGNLPPGLYVVNVEKGAPAAKAGIAPGDVIVLANGKTLSKAGEWDSLRDEAAPGQAVSLAVWRNGKTVKQTLTLGDLKQDVASGNAAAMMYAGLAFLNGLRGVGESPVAAMEWFSKAADRGDPGAMYGLGLIHYKGMGVKKDEAEALRWFRKAADLELPQAMTTVGAFYEQGRQVGQDNAAALNWYNKAAERGDPTAMGRIGDFFASGTAVPQDYVKALGWYRKAATLGDVDAMSSIGQQYEKGQGTAQDADQAFNWYLQAANLGDAKAMSRLGSYFDAGFGVAQDYGQALGWYRKAADLGDTMAMTALGRHYIDGLGAGRDYGKAFTWFQKAAELGDPMGMTSLGVQYMNGDGVTPDYEKSHALFQKAAALGNSKAMTYLGVQYEFGMGDTQDYGLALRWYQKGAASGSAEAARRAALLYAEGKGVAVNMSEALRLMRFSASKQDAMAAEWLSSHGYN